jgi:phage tail-like protein
VNRKSVISILVVISCTILIVNSFNKAAEFAVNTHRFDPYKQFKFRVKWDGRYIAGIDKVSGLHRKTQVITVRQGNESAVDRTLPGQTKYEPILLERGRTHDTEFERWANAVWQPGAGFGPGSSPDYRKDIVIELLNEAGQVALAFRVFQCWPSKYSALQEMEANSTDIAIESIVLQHEGWVRDPEVVEPAEPSFTRPR